MMHLLLMVALAGESPLAPAEPAPTVHYSTSIPLGSAMAADLPEPATLAPDRQQRASRVIERANSFQGEPWRWEGRNTTRLPGLDCLGILYLSFGAEDDRSWKAYPTDPHPLVQSGLLGKPVTGLDGVLRAEVSVPHLLPGDVLYFLREGYEIADKPLMTRADARYWPWHTGLYAGEGQVVHADPVAGVVRTQPLADIDFDALFVTR